MLSSLSYIPLSHGYLLLYPPSHPLSSLSLITLPPSKAHSKTPNPKKLTFLLHPVRLLKTAGATVQNQMRKAPHEP
jgi:hypothetical protein